MKAVILWLAQGFGIGRIPVAPGTFGSVLGVGWAALLLSFGNPLVFWGGIFFVFFVSVWLCGAGEKILGKTDPGSVVMDEIAAMPLCFAIWGINHQRILSEGWWWVLAVFLLFRLFDVWKPWPVRQSQKFSGGWGVTIDDFLAAIYVNVCVFAAMAIMGRNW